jgi:aspartate/tyrosine/aromatic aminotransferase
MVKELREKYHIYLVNSGRISIAGLNTKNVKYVAEAFHAVTKGKKL